MKTIIITDIPQGKFYETNKQYLFKKITVGDHWIVTPCTKPYPIGYSNTAPGYYCARFSTGVALGAIYGFKYQYLKEIKVNGASYWI